jgi:hypothetical protein
MTNKFRQPKVITLHKKFPVTVGDAFSFDAYLYSSPQLQQPLPLGAGTYTLEATDDSTNPTVLITKTVGSGIVVLDADLGHIRVFFTDVETASLGQYGGILVFALKFTDEDGNTFTVAKGSLLLQPDAV